MSGLPGAARTVTTPTDAGRERRATHAQRIATVAAFSGGAALALFYVVWYPRTGDVAPDSVYGYGFALAGTGLVLTAGIGYAVRKRRGRLAPAHQERMLAWHMIGVLLGLAFVLMHAAGNFNPRSGTYALYGLLSLLVSGIVGQALDRVCRAQAARAPRPPRSAAGGLTRDVLARQTSPARGSFALLLMRTWRQVHTLLGVVFLGLLAWHLIYAATLLLHTR